MKLDLVRSALLGLGLSAALGAAAHASDLPSKKGPPPAPIVPAITWFDIAVNIKGQTDYNFRGISQTDRKPGIGGGAELQIYNNLFYVGVYGSSVDLATRPDEAAELGRAGLALYNQSLSADAMCKRMVEAIEYAVSRHAKPDISK